MTYCVAIAANAGLVFVSDSRTNAGADDVRTYSKMHTFDTGGDRSLVLLSAGNLATTQGVVQQLQRDIQQCMPLNLATMPSLAEAAEYIGGVSAQCQGKHTAAGAAINYESSFIIGGQVAGAKPELYLVYPQGNYITISEDTLYLQIGEGKYGKSVLDRILKPDLNLETAALCGLVSMDSTMNSNLTVGPPIEVIVYHADSFSLNRRYRFDDDSDYLRQLKRSWGKNLQEAFNNLPPIAWGTQWDQNAALQGDEQAGLSSLQPF